MMRNEIIQILHELAIRESWEDIDHERWCFQRALGEAAELLRPGWISTADRLPENDETVLAIGQLKNGERKITLAYCNLEHLSYDPVTHEKRREPYWVCGGNNNIIYWQPLPAGPEEATNQ